MNIDSTALTYDVATFTHAIGNVLLFVLPNHGIDAVKEMHRTLKPGGKVILKLWAYVPDMEPLEAAARDTRPDGTPSSTP